LVYWPPDTPSVTTESKLAKLSSPGFVHNSLRLEGHGEVKGLAHGGALEVSALSALGAAEQPVVSSSVLGWSGRPLSGKQLLKSRQRLPDGCWSIALGETSSQSFYLCAPEWGFPFEVGDMLTVTAEERPLTAPAYGEVPSVARHLSVQVADVKMELWLNAVQSQVPEVGQVVELEGEGRRTGCGAYADPLSIEVLPLRSSLLPNEQGKLVNAGRLTRALLGRADRILVAPEICTPEYASLGSRFDLLIVTTPEPSP